MPRKIPSDRVFPTGLSTHHALSKLLAGMDAELEAVKFDIREAVRTAMSPLNANTTFPWTTALTGLVLALFLMMAAMFSKTDQFWYFLESLLIFAMTGGNVALGIYEQKLRMLEMKSRVQHVTNRLRQVKDQIHWTSSNYPHLHTPLSASIVLQWTIRDKKQVNLPWALLVERDLVLIKPGQVAPGDCHSYDDPHLRLKKGEILHIKTTTEESISPTPEFKTPATPKIFIMDETPYLSVLRKVLEKREEERPLLMLAKYAHLLFTKALVHIFLPVSFSFVIIWNLLRYIQDWRFYENKTIVQLVFVDPVAVGLPLLPLAFPSAWIIVNYIGLAWVLAVYSSSRHIRITDDPFEDNVHGSEMMEPEKKTTFTQLKRYFFSALLGKGEYLSRTENLVHTLGSITALCCTDKKGILSWPNASPEKIFFVTREKKNEKMDLNVDSNENERAYTLTPEILTVTYNRHNPFKVEFDDPSWNKFLDFLKPLGLGILLNTCNISTEEKYTNFFNHLICESIRASNKNKEESGNGDKNSSIDMLPIVTRGCLCELALKIGFDRHITSQYALTHQIQTFKHVEPDSNDKFARNLSLARLKFPFPHLVSVIVQHRATGSRQLISQGTSDIVLDSCTDCWSGKDLEVLTEDIRKKILDFYHRASLSSYCTAFAMRPLTFPLPWKNVKEYLQLPTHSNPFYWQYNELAEYLDADFVTSRVYLGDRNHSDDQRKDDFYVKTKEDAMLCLELECNQTFLGMIQLQYQAVVEVVQLIDLLEKACIRFVHFSKENELRSRVFSEKMGLESGWNCHISLKSSQSKKRETVSCRSPSKSRSPKDTSESKLRGLQDSHRLASSLPDFLNRPAWFLDFPKWQEVKGNHINGDNIDDQGSNVNLLANEGLESPQEKPNQIRMDSITSDSDPFEYDMSNRAQLPRGIENIRPHLETMDNVPLLVSLFTDCTPATTTEMLKIMQEYGEVVCVMGSSANYENIGIFLQANASLAIEPRYPQLCQRVPVCSPTKSGPSPVAISQLLNAVASSLSFKMEDEISIFHLIMESRHFTISLLTAMKFWMCCLLTLSIIQLGSLLLALPLFITPGETLWMSVVYIPLLSASLMGCKTDPSVMTISTGKNHIVTNFEIVKYALWCYGLRFIPAIVLLLMCHLINVVEMLKTCYGNAEGMLSVSLNETLMNEVTDDIGSVDCKDGEVFSVDLSQYLNFSFLFLYFAVISMSFISRDHQLWQRTPLVNKTWVIVVSVLLTLTMLVGCFEVIVSFNDLYVAGASVWVLWFCGLILVVFINEIVKRLEIKVEVRHQKRERLEFGTKLGINSPF